MINKIYNIIIFMHFAQLSIDNYLNGCDKSVSDNWSKDHNQLPDHVKEYLKEKSEKYLGIDIQVDYNKVFAIMYGSILVEEINVLIDQFEPYIDKISDKNNYSPEEIDNTIIPGWITSKPTVTGADFSLSTQIVDYIKVYYSDNIKELIRDLQIKTVLKSIPLQ